MAAFAMLSKSFTMIGHDGNQCPVEETAFLQLFEEVADDGVSVGDLSVVWIGRIAALERFRRIVGRVRIKEMNPNKCRDPRILFEPCERFRHNIGATVLESLVAILS